MKALKDTVVKELTRKSKYFQFFAGWGDFLFFQTNDGVLWGCGANSWGQLSLGTKRTGVRSPLKVVFFAPGSKKEILEVSVGQFHALFRTLRSGAFSSGCNDESQLSDSTSDDRSLAVPVVVEDEKAKILSVVAGYECSYLLSVEFEVFSAGRNDCGQLGHGDKENVSIGKKISSLSDIVQIATGLHWVIFRSKKSNALFGCGRDYGQFALGCGFDQSVPAEISFFKERNIKIDFLVSSTMTAFFVTSDNQVYCSGKGDMGQFGNGEKKNSKVPVLSLPLSDFQIFCSGNSRRFVVIKKKNCFYGCGWRLFGDTEPEIKPDHFLSPVEITSLRGNDVKQIVTRGQGAYAICADGSIYATGCGGRVGTMMNGKKEDSKKKFIFVGKYDLKINPRVTRATSRSTSESGVKMEVDEKRKSIGRKDDKGKREKKRGVRNSQSEQKTKSGGESFTPSSGNTRRKPPKRPSRKPRVRRRPEEERKVMERKRAEENRKLEESIRMEMEKEMERKLEEKMEEMERTREEENRKMEERIRIEMERENQEKAEEEKKKKLERKLKKAMISISHVQRGRRIGRGAMGEVYEGIWTKSGGRTPVAIKEISLKKSLVLEDLEEFFVMYECHHLMVLPVFGFCHSPEEQIVWIVMKKMHASLFKYLYGIRKSGLKLSEKLDLMEKVTSCIQYLHLKEQIIHRDIKSLNFLVNKTGSELCVTDFGLVKSRNSQTFVKTSEDIGMERTKGQGTQRWMSPEILDYPAKYSIYSDIYALGMVFYEILNQKVPFDDEYSSGAMNDRNFDRAVMKGVRPKFKKNVPRGFVELVEKCWVHEAKKRLTTEEILKEIEKLQGVVEALESGQSAFFSNRPVKRK